MSINLKKLSNIKNFYEIVPYYVNKGGKDGMAELAQQYKILAKMHRIKIPKVERLLEAHSAIKSETAPIPKCIKHLEQAALLLAATRCKQLTEQFVKMQMSRLSP